MSSSAPDRRPAERAIVGALRSSIRAHGPITLEHLGSAAKRVLGNLLNAAAKEDARSSPGTAVPLEPGEARPVTLLALLCRCARCGHEWLATSRTIGSEPEAPATCARCKTPAWRTLAGTVRRGRPPKARAAQAKAR